MNRADVISTVLGLERALRSQGLSSIYLFGSVARGSAGSGSDIDFAFDRRSDAVFDAFDLGRIAEDLADALGARVDLVERCTFSARFNDAVASDLTQIF